MKTGGKGVNLSCGTKQTSTVTWSKPKSEEKLGAMTRSTHVVMQNRPKLWRKTECKEVNHNYDARETKIQARCG